MATTPCFQVDAFTARAFRGNPAAVCLLDKSRSAKWMQDVAAEMNLSETAFVTLLLTKVSGIPILEKSADERWGSEAKYQEYKRNTPCLVPRLPGLGSAKAV